MNTSDLQAVLVKAVKRASAHGYPCSSEAERVIKTDIAEALWDHINPYGGDDRYQEFLIQCGLRQS